jgi:hypothetical protein
MDQAGCAAAAHEGEEEKFVIFFRGFGRQAE